MTTKVVNVIPTLQKARDLIAQKNGYVRGTRMHAAPSATGYAFCALGAVAYAKKRGSAHQNNEQCSPELIALDKAIPKEAIEAMEDGRMPDECNHTRIITRDHPVGCRIACYSNNAGQEKVVEWFDRAIELQREHPMERE